MTLRWISLLPLTWRLRQYQSVVLNWIAIRAWVCLWVFFLLMTGKISYALIVEAELLDCFSVFTTKSFSLHLSWGKVGLSVLKILIVLCELRCSCPNHEKLLTNIVVIS